jgi:hypothetical protein
MEEPSIAETSQLDSEVAQTVLKIQNQTNKLKKDGLTEGDLKLLKIRLQFVWGKGDNNERKNTTAWRKNNAKKRYISIQGVSAHLFLAVILAIAPTECGEKPFQNVHHYLIRLENYDAFHVDLKLVDKQHMETLAMQAGFSEDHRYKTLLQALFPQDSSVPTSTNNTPRR